MGGGDVAKLLGRWVAKLVARLLAAAALWDRIQTYLKNNVQNGRHKQRSGQHRLARPNKYTKNCFAETVIPVLSWNSVQTYIYKTVKKLKYITFLTGFGPRLQ